MRPDDLLADFDIDRTPIWPEDDARLEPIFFEDVLWFDFDEHDYPEPELADEELAAALPDGTIELAELDPERLEDTPEPAAAAPPRASLPSFLGSLGVHLLTLAIFLTWSNTPAELGGTIPVQLVIEQAPPAPDEVVPSDVAADIGAALPKTEAAPPPQPPSAPKPVPPPIKPAAVQPKPPPKPPEPKPPSEPKPKESAVAAIPVAARSPAPAAMPLPVPTPTTATPTQSAGDPAASNTQIHGSAIGKGDYYAYLVTLTRSHFDVLPLSYLAGRRGHTILQVTVFEDGTIGRIAVKQGSGYPDIDARIGQMVQAVGRFPPLPEALRRPSVDLDFNLTFPDALQR